MSASRQPWFGAAFLAGIAYVFIGRVFALPAEHVQAWRLAAWVVSGAVYAAHIWYEAFTLRNPPTILALHAAVGAALGGFGLAVAGMVHAMASDLPIGILWLLALVLWPAVTAIPAFIGAFAAGAVVARIRPSRL